MIETKLRRPRLPDTVIERDAASVLLDKALDRSLTVISAPPGFGKTTLVAQWAESRQIPHAWLSLDEFDNDSQAFWQGICAALGRVDARFSDRVWPRFSPFEAIDPALGIQALVRELTDFSRSWKAPRAIALILDDFHVIEDESLLAQFAYFLDYCPDLLHCLVISRHLPELGLAKRRVRHQLLELGTQDLRFDLAASERFLLRRLELRLTPVQLRMLHQKTEGWIAALQLAGLSLARNPERLDALPEFSGRHHFLSDYLLAEVFEGQSPETQSFLMKVAILPCFSAALLVEALQDKTAPAFLDRLIKRNLFLQPLDADSQWYSLHDLFRDWLKAQEQDESISSEICRRASNWLEGHGRAFEAAELLVERESWSEAAEVLARSLETWILSGEVFRAERLLRRLPNNLIQTSPGLLFLQAIRSFNQGHYEDASRVLDKLDGMLEQGVAAPGFGLAPISSLTGLVHEDALSTLSLFLRSHIASYTGQMTAASTLIRDLATRPELTSSAFNVWIRQGIGAHEFANGQLHLAKGHLVSAMTQAEQQGDIFCQVVTLATLVPTLLHRGEILEGWGWIERLEKNLGSGWRQHTMAATLPHFRCMLLREENRLEAAEQECQDALALGLPKYSTIDRTYFSFLGWMLAMSRRDFQAALQLIDEMKTINIGRLPSWPYVIPEPATLGVITALAVGKPDALRDWAQGSLPGQPDEPMLRVSVERLIWCRGRFLGGEDVLKELQAVREWAKLGEVRQRELQTFMLEASVHFFRNDITAMQRAMVSALTLSARGGFTRSVLDEGPHVGRMLQACLGHPLVQNEARRLLEELGVSAALPQETAPPPVEALSGRELELVALLDEGMSNQAIAEALGISASTVKAHLRNIYGKLGARNRAHALAIARQNNLLKS